MEKTSCKTRYTECPNDAAERKNRQCSQGNDGNENKNIGISEMRWRGNGELRNDGFYVAYSGNDDLIGGFGIIVHPSLASKKESTWAVSDRVIVTKVKNLYHFFCIIKFYAPTCDNEDAAVDRVYGDIENVLKKAKNSESVIVMGDFNAVVGNLPEKPAVGRHGLGTRNYRGTNLWTGAR